MRLLHVIASMNPEQGGVCQAVRTMIGGLTQLGVYNEVVSLDAPNASWAEYDPFPLHLLGPGKGPWCYSPTLIPWLLNHFACFDAVIMHGLWLYHGYALRQALRTYASRQPTAGQNNINSPKLLIMPHGMLDPYFQRASGRRLKAWRNWAYWHLIEAAVVNDATGLLFTCETERLLAHEPFTPYRPMRELVIGMGVTEPPALTTAIREAFLMTCPQLQNRPYILFLSRVHEKKGVELLIQSYKTFISRRAEAIAGSIKCDTREASSNVSSAEIPALIIAGPGLDTPYGQRLQHLAAELPEAAIYFPGMLTGDAKWGAFYGCDAFVLPSHQENFGIAVVEALACNKPVLISNQVNIWREIEAAGGGLVEEDTLAGTQRLLERWLALTALEKRAMGTKAMAAYQKYFAVSPPAEKLIAALRAELSSYTT